jgi:hypothetical protein
MSEDLDVLISTKVSAGRLTITTTGQNRNDRQHGSGPRGSSPDQSIGRFGDRFVKRIYTPAEIAYVERKANKFERPRASPPGSGHESHRHRMAPGRHLEGFRSPICLKPASAWRGGALCRDLGI